MCWWHKAFYHMWVVLVSQLVARLFGGRRAGSCHARHAGAKQEEDSRTKTWEAGSAETFASGWVRKPPDGGPGGHARGPRPAQLRRCVGERVCARRGPRRGGRCRGRGDSGCRLQGCASEWASRQPRQPLGGPPGPPRGLHIPAHSRAARAESLLGRWGEAPRGLGLSAWREAVSGNSAGPEARPTLRLWGWGSGGGALRPGACHVPSLSEGLPPPPLPPALPRMEEGCCSPPGS